MKWIASILAKCLIILHTTLQRMNSICGNMEEQEQKYEEHRQYFSLIEKVGSWGRYQMLLFIIFFLVSFLEASLIFILPYLLHQTKYECSGLSKTQCKEYVCSLLQEDRMPYLPTAPYYSLADQFGNYRCQKQQQLRVIQTLVFLGGCIGMSVFMMITENFGRKLSLQMCLGIMLIGLAIVISSRNLAMVGVGIFVIIFGTETSYQFVFCFCSQVVAENHRITYMNLLGISYGIGIISNSLAFKYVDNWQVIMLVMHVIPAAVAFLGVNFIVQDTPIELLQRQQPYSILSALQKIAKINGKDEIDLHINDIVNMKSLYYQHSHAKHAKNFTTIDILMFPSLRKIAIPLLFLNFLYVYLFYAPTFISKESEDNIFQNGIISGLSSLFSVPFCWLLLEKFQRKHIMYFSNTLMLVLSLLIYSMQCHENCSHSQSTINKIVFFIYRLAISISFTAVYTVNYEIFPAQVRASGSIFVYMIGETAGIIQPWIVSLCQTYKFSVILTFSIAAFCALFITYFMKETYGVAPPEVIEELEDVQ